MISDQSLMGIFAVRIFGSWRNVFNSSRQTPRTDLIHEVLLYFNKSFEFMNVWMLYGSDGVVFLLPLNEFNKTFHFLTIESADEAISVF